MKHLLTLLLLLISTAAHAQMDWPIVAGGTLNMNGNAVTNVGTITVGGETRTNLMLYRLGNTTGTAQYEMNKVAGFTNDGAWHTIPLPAAIPTNALFITGKCTVIGASGATFDATPSGFSLGGAGGLSVYVQSAAYNPSVVCMPYTGTGITVKITSGMTGCWLDFNGYLR